MISSNLLFIINKFFRDYGYDNRWNTICMCELGNQHMDALSRGIQCRTGKDYFTHIGIGEHISIDLNGLDGSLKLDLSHPINLYKKHFDIVTNFGTSEHVSNQVEVFRNIHNFLKDGGISINFVPLVGSWPGHCQYYYDHNFFDILCDLNRYELINSGKISYPDKYDIGRILLWGIFRKTANSSFNFSGESIYSKNVNGSLNKVYNEGDKENRLKSSEEVRSENDFDIIKIDGYDYIVEGKMGGYSPYYSKDSYHPNLWSWCVNKLGIKSVLDIGCAEGQALKFFNDLGCIVHGVDGCKKAIRDNLMPLNVGHIDLESSYLLTDDIYDMIWCCEVVEHIDERAVNNIMRSFNNANWVFMTHASKSDGGHHHVNCQSSEYWIAKMKLNRFEYCHDLTMEARSTLLNKNAFFNRSGMIFRKIISKRKYFGIGMSKCGTCSLADAMALMGYRVIHCPSLRQLNNLDQFDFANDLPIYHRFDDLDIRYPGSKFIYNYRDIDGFIDAARRHWDRVKVTGHIQSDHVKERLLEVFGCMEFNEKLFRKAFERHHGKVMDYFADRKDDLLVMDICSGDGWEKLAPFIGRDISMMGISFPYSNRGKD